MMMTTLKEGLLNKTNIRKVSYPISVKIHKKNLKDGDICLQGDNEAGIYISNIDSDIFGISDSYNGENGILFYYPIASEWTPYLISSLDNDLKDIDGETEYDVIKIARNLCNIRWLKDHKKLEELLVKVNKEKTLDYI